MVVKIKIA